MNKKNKEKVKLRVCSIEGCGRPTHRESKYCIFHAGAQEKTEEEFKIALKKYTEEIKEEDKDYDFSGFIFIGNINFKDDLNITIFKNANFMDATFKGEVYFVGIIVKGNMSTIFKGNTNFIDATFEGNVYFSGAGTIFKGDAAFINATFEEKVDFESVTFKEGADFMYATFEGDLYFDNAIFKRYLSFLGATLPPGKNLELRVKNEVKKKRIISGSISFQHAFLENNYLSLDLDEGVLIDFTDALLRNTKIEKSQIENHILQENKKEFSEAQEVFLLLKNNFHSIGRYNDESWAYKKEKDMERKSYYHLKSSHKWLWSCFLNGIFGYSEQPGKVIVSAILVILLFASFFMISGISNVGIEFNTSNSFLDCLYFSTVTFTTLGYGDFRPLEGWGRILAGSEAFIGAFMMALFVYTFARRTGGR